MRRPPKFELTPEGRIAAVVSNLTSDMLQQVNHGPDFADIRDAVAPWILRDILLACIAEARTCGRDDRVSALISKLKEIAI